MSSKSVAVVTGSNKGIGFAIVRGLCKQFNGDVILTSRDENRGRDAIQKLEKEGLKPKFHQLTIDDESSIQTFKSFLLKNYGGLDILVNNAGILYDKTRTRESTKTAFEMAKHTVEINYHATKNFYNTIFPLMRKHSRVVNMTSCEGNVAYIKNIELREQFLDPDLSVEKIDELMQSYLSDMLKGNNKEKGWARTSYRMSKIALNAWTFIQHRKLNENPELDIIINAVHPGYVATDMTQNIGHLTTEQGAKAPIYLALLPPNVESPRGQFIWFDCKIAEWNDTKTPDWMDSMPDN